jgi:hypothetical protein
MSSYELYILTVNPVSLTTKSTHRSVGWYLILAVYSSEVLTNKKNLEETEPRNQVVLKRVPVGCVEGNV